MAGLSRSAGRPEIAALIAELAEAYDDFNDREGYSPKSLAVEHLSISSLEAWFTIIDKAAGALDLIHTASQHRDQLAAFFLELGGPLAAVRDATTSSPPISVERFLLTFLDPVARGAATGGSIKLSLGNVPKVEITGQVDATLAMEAIRAAAQAHRDNLDRELDEVDAEPERRDGVPTSGTGTLYWNGRWRVRPGGERRSPLSLLDASVADDLNRNRRYRVEGTVTRRNGQTLFEVDRASIRRA